MKLGGTTNASQVLATAQRVIRRAETASAYDALLRAAISGGLSRAGRLQSSKELPVEELASLAAFLGELIKAMAHDALTGYRSYLVDGADVLLFIDCP